VLRPVLLREDVLRVEVPRRAAVARPPARPAARFCAVVPARPPLRPAAARRAEVVLRDVVLREVLRARVPVVRLVPVERERVLVLRPIGLRGLRAAARPPARAAAVRFARVVVLRPLVLRLVVLLARRRVPPVRFLVPSSSTTVMSSNMCLLLLRDFLDDLACLLVLAHAGDIGLGQDSNQAPVLLRDGEPADLVLSHQAQRFIQVLFRIDGNEIA
jgi:hypothetical protein